VATAEPAPAAVTRGAAAISGKAVLQIGSFPSPALADAAWTKFQRGHAGAVSGLSPDVMPVQIPGKGTWYRLRIGPFPDRAAANTKCAQLKAQGATCLVATP
jgi:cell division septation protein DedD